MCFGGSEWICLSSLLSGWPESPHAELLVRCHLVVSLDKGCQTFLLHIPRAFLLHHWQLLFSEALDNRSAPELGLWADCFTPLLKMVWWLPFQATAWIPFISAPLLLSLSLCDLIAYCFARASRTQYRQLSGLKHRHGLSRSFAA